ncbi:MAG: hypothetical protein O3B22_05880 [Proteobacteria bacterium]|nr:hypothetical protein [Pseudomonadota bacterium]
MVVAIQLILVLVLPFVAIRRIPKVRVHHAHSTRAGRIGDGDAPASIVHACQSLVCQPSFHDIGQALAQRAKGNR